MNKKIKVLIVEDEILIARSIERYLVKKDYNVVGVAISYEEATKLYLKEKPDLALLDIRLNGEKTGIDVANFIRTQSPISIYIYLTSQIDRNNLQKAGETLPAGYLSKPIQKNSLYSTIEMAVYKYSLEIEKEETSTISLFDGTRNHLIEIKDILFLQIEHVYIHVHLKNNTTVITRSTLKELMAELARDMFLQTHRSFAVNIKNVTSWNSEEIYLNGHSVPISRSRKKLVHSQLKA